MSAELRYYPDELCGRLCGQTMTATAKMTATKVESLAQTPGRHSIGESLYLTVSGASKRWTFVYRFRRSGEPAPGKRYEMGLGSFPDTSLKDARAAVAKARELLKDKVNPIDARKIVSEIPAFGAVADEVFKVRSAEMRNAKAIYRMKRALEHHAKTIRGIPVNEVRTDDVLKVLQPIWLKTPDAASKVRGYLEMVLDAAKAKGYRSGENPAAWRGHLDHLLQRQPKLVRGHHAALPFNEIPTFVAELRTRDAVAARGLEFLILTAARSGEVFGARWSEIDLAAKVWTIPGERMKGGREHRVPLPSRCVEILDEMKALRASAPDAHVFPGRAAGGGLSGMAFAMLLRRMGREDLTTHGFRSTFRDWAGESTNFPREVAEAALAHAVGDDVERAYRRGDALEKRRKLMDAWAGYLSSGSRPDNVRQFGRQTVG